MNRLEHMEGIASLPDVLDYVCGRNPLYDVSVFYESDEQIMQGKYRRFTDLLSTRRCLPPC